MKKIQMLADQMEDELEGAKCYIETALDLKANGNSNWASKYKSMAEQELSHASTIHERTVEEINKIKSVYTPPEEMESKWTKEHKKYVEKFAWVKQMISMF